MLSSTLGNLVSFLVTVLQTSLYLPLRHVFYFYKSQPLTKQRSEMYKGVSSSIRLPILLLRTVMGQGEEGECEAKRRIQNQTKGDAKQERVGRVHVFDCPCLPLAAELTRPDEPPLPRVCFSATRKGYMMTIDRRTDC